MACFLSTSFCHRKYYALIHCFHFASEWAEIKIGQYQCKPKCDIIISRGKKVSNSYCLYSANKRLRYMRMLFMLGCDEGYCFPFCLHLQSVELASRLINI